MRRRLLIYSAVLAVSLSGVVVLCGDNQSMSEGSQTRDVAQTLLQEGVAGVRREVSVSATTAPKTIQHTENSHGAPYSVVRVVDGDTLDVLINGKVERIRLIGIDTPETVDPRKPVQCFGIEASNKAKTLLMGKEVMLEGDPTQGERDKYGRLLRYVFLPDSTNFNLRMIKEGYAHEYTYTVRYRYQTEFKDAQKEAMGNKAGLWGAECAAASAPIISSQSAQTPPHENNNTSGTCTIKGNINANQEKIYHLIGCGSYEKTAIDESAGEKLFCTEQDAINAGWRKAKNC